MFFDTNWKDKNPVCNPLSDDWFIWNPKAQNIGDWDVCIKCYINIAEIIATNLRNNIGSNDNIYNILGFLFSVRQAIELSLKRLSEIKKLDIIENHNLLDVYNKIKNLYDWKKYGIDEKQLDKALTFMQEKNQIFRYPHDKKKSKYEVVAIHLIDWLNIIHTLYFIIAEEQERNEINVQN